MIEGINKSAGKVQKADAVCDQCGHREQLTTNYIRQPTGEWVPNAVQARAKLTKSGWSYIKKKLRCPQCETARKQGSDEAPVAPVEEPRQPSKRQRIDIFTLLADVYDIEAGRYQNGDTDETVADVLDVMPGWVAQIREAEFGPDGSNEDIEKLIARVTAMEEAAEKQMAAIDEALEAAKKARDVAYAKHDGSMFDLREVRNDLEKIKKAVGPRVLRNASVSARQ